jgi:hypothetical protein
MAFPLRHSCGVACKLFVVFAQPLFSTIVCLLPWVIYLYQLHCFVFTARTLSEVYAILFYHAQRQRYFYQTFM